MMQHHPDWEWMFHSNSYLLGQALADIQWYHSTGTIHIDRQYNLLDMARG